MTLFKAADVAKLTLPNRLAVAAMSRMQANADGTVSANMPAYYARYASEGVGLVITEAAYTDQESAQAYFNQPGLATDAQRDSWRAVTDAVHSAGRRIFVQLQHGGRLNEPGLNRLHLAASDGVAAGNTWQTGLANQPANAATKEQIDMVVRGFRDAARRAKEAGFDGVEIHGARGYLVDQFLSASTNSRDDEYGGTLERRLRFPREVVRAVRDAVGEMPVSFNFSLYKMDDTKYQPPGGRDEVIAIARELVSSGADILHVTTRKVLRDEPWGEPLAVTVRNAVPDAGLIVNGGITGLEQAEQALEGTQAQCVSIARALLANPDWIHKVRTSMPRRDYVPGMERQALLAAECQELQAL